MKLYELLKGLDYTILQGNDIMEIENICWDSRKIKRNSLFICVKNRNVDRHDFALNAVKEGAIAVVVDHDIKKLPDNITIIKVCNSRLALSTISSTYYNNPSKNLKLIGITGTNGKTSVSYYISNILDNCGYKTGVIGTIENKLGDKILQTEKLNPTTPDPIELQSSFQEFLSLGATHIAMEVTSSALSQNRVYGCNFHIGVFTNLTQDHLEEHGTMENYKRAKMKLFSMCEHGVVNADDAVHKEIIDTSNCKILTYGIDNNADFTAKNVQLQRHGVSFTLLFNNAEHEVSVNIPGKFTVYNLLAAIASCYVCGVSIEKILESLKYIKEVPGRFQTVENPKGTTIIIDYAHSPDSLKNILLSVREITAGKLITVFGCGGDRDKMKRPIMGEIASTLSDICILTSDNPRKEDPLSIISDIETGIKNTKNQYYKFANRRKAIYEALRLAKPEDTLVIAGKGHENYQIMGDMYLYFSDAEVVEDFFKNIYRL